MEFDVAELVADPGLMLYTYSAEPGSSSEHALRLLASWAADEMKMSEVSTI